MTSETAHSKLHLSRGRRLAVSGSVVTLLGGGVTGLILAAPAGASTPMVKTHSVAGHGMVLVNAKGETLYVDTSTTSCTATCQKTWVPDLLPKGATKVTAASGVTGLGTVRHSGHRLQVTAHHKPLYTFTGDRKAGQDHGQGLEGVWFAATPAGMLAATVPATASTTTTAPQSTTTAPSSSVTPTTSGAAASPQNATATPTPAPTTVAPASQSTTTTTPAATMTTEPAATTTSTPTVTPTTEPTVTPTTQAPPPPTTTTKPAPPPTTTTTAPGGGAVGY
jgi:predicted lipoprotein with Yx(FWY)xxD motif